MKVKELIEQLEKFDDEIEIYIDWDWQADFIKDDTFINWRILIY